MNKLSKEKKEKLILTIIGVLGVLGLLYTFVLGAQKDQLNALNVKLAAIQDKLNKAERLVRNSEGIAEELGQMRADLQVRQAEMAPQGQYYYWFLKLVDGFRQEMRLEPNFIMDVTQPEFASVGLIPEFPYKAGYFGVRVNGEFQEVGRFFAEFENRFPYMRIQNVKLQPFLGESPASTLTAANPETGEARPAQAAALAKTPGRRIIAEFKIVTLFNPGT